MIRSFFMFYLIFIISILTHELAHYLLVRVFGYSVEEFSFGCGPEMLKKKIGSTNISLKLLPFLAYVKIRDLQISKNKKEALIYLAGPACNLFFGVLLNYLSYKNFAIIPVALFILNILPVSGSDGEKIIMSISGWSYRGLKNIKFAGNELFIRGFIFILILITFFTLFR